MSGTVYVAPFDQEPRGIGVLAKAAQAQVQSREVGCLFADLYDSTWLSLEEDIADGRHQRQQRLNVVALGSQGHDEDLVRPNILLMLDAAVPALL